MTTYNIADRSQPGGVYQTTSFDVARIAAEAGQRVTVATTYGIADRGGVYQTTSFDVARIAAEAGQDVTVTKSSGEVVALESLLTIADLASMYEMEPFAVLAALAIDDAEVESLGDRTPVEALEDWTEQEALEALEQLAGWAVGA